MIRRLAVISFFVLVFIKLLWAGEKVLIPEFFDRYKASYVKVNDRGNIWIAYYDLKHRIHIRNITGDKGLIVNEGGENYSEGLAFDVQGDNAYVVWREKVQGRKKLYFRATYDGGKTLSERILLDDDTTEALTRIEISSNSKGDVFVLWLGEKKTADSQYNIYSISSNDFGRTFSKIENLSAGYKHSIYPVLLTDEKNAYAFIYCKKGDKRYMVFRKTTDSGRSWSRPVEIKEIGVVSVLIKPVKVGNRLHVFWFNTYNEVPVMEGAYSDDGGNTWKTMTFEDTRGLDAGILKVASDSKEHIHLALYGLWEKGQKRKVYVLRSEDNGETWGKLIPVRHYPFENTNAQNPDIYATDDGEVIVVWVDYRNIRSNLYMQYSNDHGKSWQEKDIPLEEPGRYNTAIYPYSDSIIKIKDRYYVLAYRFKDDLTLEKANLLMIDFKLDDRGRK